MLRNKVRWLAVIILGLIGVFALTAHSAAKPMQQVTWNQVWSDEFNGTGVDFSNWTYETGGSGGGNHELEYYTNGQNVTVGGGVLTITANKGSGGYTCWNGTCQYTS